MRGLFTDYEWQMLRLGFMLWNGIDFMMDLIDVRREDFKVR